MPANIAMASTAEQKLSRINELAKQAAGELGLVLLDIRFGQQGKSKSLELSIFRKNPAIGFSDCEQMSRALERLLEQENQHIIGPYLLEVHSPGTERQLTTSFEFNLFAGSMVRIVAKEKIASLGMEFAGTLLGGDEETVAIAEAFPLVDKSTKSKSKKQARQLVLSAHLASDKLTIDLQKIYRVHLCPDAKKGH